MPAPSLLKLHLAAPLFYRKEPGIRPFVSAPPGGEILIRFEIAPSQVLAFEPDGAEYLARLDSAGILEPAGEAELPGPGGAEGYLELPRGDYFFAQAWEALDREAFIALAVEVQKEALWQRLVPDSPVYLRYLHEENRPVTQVFRPLARGGKTA
jgi:hypothetical protein